MVATEILWQVKTEKPFITVTNGKVFKDNENSILTGGEDGIVRLYAMPDRKTAKIKSVRSLETKCGPIFHLRLHDIIRLVSQDLIAADSRGSITVFCHGQIFMRTMPEKPAGITALQIHESALGHLYIITGTEDGIVNCFNAFTNLWKIRLADIVVRKVENPRASPSVTCVIATSISSTGCSAMDYVVVADSDKNLHFVQEGKVLLTISTPAVVKAMVVGHFLHFDETSESDEKLTQIALGCDDGTLWVCVDFEIQTGSQYADVGHPVTQLHRLPPLRQTHPSSDDKNGLLHKQGQAGSASDERLDILLCTGHFSAVFVLREGQVMKRHPLPDWAISMCGLSQHTSDDKECNTVLVGCQDSTLQAVKIV